MSGIFTAMIYIGIACIAVWFIMALICAMLCTATFMMYCWQYRRDNAP